MRRASGDGPSADRVAKIQASGPPAASAAPPVNDRPWAQLLRAERWQEGLAQLALEPEAVRSQPLVRYAAAVAAEHVGNAEATLSLLVGLENALPLLAEGVRARRAQAAFRQGDWRTALDFFGTRVDSASRLRAAEAHFKMGEPKLAQASLESLLRALPRRASTCAFEAPAHRLLSEVLPSEPAALRAREHRWLATQAPLCDSASGAEERLAALSPALRLTANERLARAEAFAEAGRVEAVELELRALSAADLGKMERGTPDSLRGLSRLKARTELDRAAELLAGAAALNASSAASWLYQAGRAKERAGADAAAAALYERVVRGYPKSPQVEHAAYRLAQLSYSGGKFEAASKAYDAYLARFGARARYADDARDERALSWLVAGRAADAAREFHGLAQKASDRRIRARYAELEAVALFRAGKVEPARELFRQVLREHPLSFAALCAAARLSELGEAPSPAIPSATTSARVQPALTLALPAKAALLHEAGLDREAESALAEVESSVVSAHPGRGDEALCALYGRLAPAERAYRAGQRAATVDELAAAPSLGRRWLWDCVYPRPYAPLVAGLAAEQSLEAELLYAVMRQESSFRPEVVSPARAVGLLQLMPATASRLSAELGLEFDAARLVEPPMNVRLGARYLRKLLDWFAGNLALAAAGYNAGPIAVERWLRSSPGLELDLFVARIPYEETRTYVERVVGNHARYRYLGGGEAAVPKVALALPSVDLSGQDLY
jgi:soluble lytic murein transglycosylase